MQVAKRETQAEGGCSPRPAQGLLPGAVCVGDDGRGSLSQQGLPSLLGTQPTAGRRSSQHNLHSPEGLLDAGGPSALMRQLGRSHTGEPGPSLAAKTFLPLRPQFSRFVVQASDILYRKDF